MVNGMPAPRLGQRLVLLLTLLLAPLASSCGDSAPPLLSPFSRQVVDMAGNTVRLPREVRRIACLEVLCYEKLFLLGASDRIVMMTQTNAPWMERTNPAVKDILKIPAEPNSEELLNQHMDVVFRTTSYPSPGRIETLARLGVPILVSQAGGKGRLNTLAEFVDSRKQMLRLFGQVLGPAYLARAEAWCAYHDQKVALVRARIANIPPAQRIRLFHVRGGPQTTQTHGSYSSNTFGYGELAGANMVVKNHPLVGRGEVSIEEILKWDPQVINIGRHYSAELITKDPRWAQVSAVKNGRVHELPEGVFYWDGSTEGVLLMLYIAKELYPERFADLDLKQEIREYYARFYRVHLSDHELALMLQGKGPDGLRRNTMGT